jgi:hypothetical protein
VIFGVSDDGYASTVLGERISFRDRISGVVGSLGMNVRTDLANDGPYIEFRKDNYSINGGECSKDFRALILWHQGAALAFKSADGVVGVYSYDELATEGFGRAKVTHMTNMQQIEIAVRKSDVFT